MLIFLAVLHPQGNPGGECGPFEQVTKYPTVLRYTLLVERATGLLPLSSDFIEGNQHCKERETLQEAAGHPELPGQGEEVAGHRPVRSRAALSISAF